jgi:hypothetical protein
MKFKFPSVQSLWRSFLQVISRFPLQVLLAVVATLVWCYVVDAGGAVKRIEEQLIEFLAVGNLALTLLLAADLYAEVNHFNRVKQWGLRLLMVLICTGLYFLLHPYFYLADVYRIGLFVFAFHLLVAFAPFIKKGNLNGFWQYNKTLFLRFLTAALYAAVLFAGLAIALLAIDGLFSVKIGWQTYMRLFAVVTAGFMTIFFLAGLPDDFDALNREEDYPKGLKIFTQYVLIPLMSIYLAILLVYEVKIIINWELPKGLVSTLILGYAVFGILSLLLIYPVKEKEGNGWMKLFSRFFYVMMIPLVLLLLLAVWKRVGSYGITESRYILIILAIWLTLITAYFLISKKQNIKIIPVSLCILALLATYGPQSAFSVSKYSQVIRLKKLMVAKAKKDMDQRASVVRYLVEQHGLIALQPFTNRNLSELESEIELNSDSLARYTIKNTKIDTAFALLNIKREGYKVDSSIQFAPEGEEAVSVKGYDFVITLNGYASLTESMIQGLTVTVKKEEKGPNLKVHIGDRPEVTLEVTTIIKNAIAQYKTNQLHKGKYGAYLLSPDLLSIKQETAQYELKLVLSDLKTITATDDQVKLNDWVSYNGFLLIGIK